MDNDTIRLAVLEAVEASLKAQIKAIRSLRSGDSPAFNRRQTSAQSSGSKSRSHIDMTYDILTAAGGPLHVTEIISRISARFDVHVDRESLVSALSKRVARQDRFERTDKNTFALITTKKSAPRP